MTWKAHSLTSLHVTFATFVGFLVFTSPLKAEQAPEGYRWIQLASRATPEEARELASEYSGRVDEVRIFRAKNGWYAVVGGLIGHPGSRERIAELIAAGTIPNDAYAVRGIDFTNKISLEAPASYTCSGDEYLNRYIDYQTYSDFLVLALDCEDEIWRVALDQAGREIIAETEVSIPLGQTVTLETIDNSSVSISVSTRTIDGMEYLSADVTSELFGSFTAASNSFRPVGRTDCVSSHGDGGFVDSWIFVNYPIENAGRLSSLVASNGWQAVSSDGEPAPSPQLVLGTESECDDAGDCTSYLHTGIGNEFLAISRITQTLPEVCAWREGAPAGAPPIQVVGVPFGVFRTDVAFSSEALRAAIQERVVDVAFSDNVSTSAVRRVDVGKEYIFTALAPDRELGITVTSGYWYQANVSIGIGLNVFSGDITDTVHITILDLIEIEAPSNIPTVPPELIRAGRRLDFFDPITLGTTDDAEKFISLMHLVGDRVAESTGGYLESGWR